MPPPPTPVRHSNAPNPLQPGLPRRVEEHFGSGIFVTCVQSKERKAALQFIDLLNEVADRLYPGSWRSRYPKVRQRRMMLVRWIWTR